ncbi:putative ribonucleotide reductase beta subunit [Pseudomonas phage vB_PaeM_VL12]|uniref:ribonucleoside-diphosphate reductase n=7 Tax=Nankokuvirus TaxID=1925779 RepID=A0A218L419_9CAUD|nr:ribonucleotide-diphosphate reductase subunit beta [Pseudomonas aeruginosa]YP_004306815.1 puative ribonucleotide reductase [Pseudomonas phage KPP10]YP_009206081.1 ribonucleoside-diphosphate reductase subunit beta [Pseudomonas phage vB_PaeM_PS24]YP_009604747.1 putative ribonucleotide reductase [Pseudomonas phage vB_PaeM_G1]QIQ63824.1 hypothetical protein Epa24_00115 [Pseudomonas phage Epa24]QIQ64078.1 hypothetical protein Epa17_00042 [Pseudomonas phage Epa17]QIQ64970.1 hypothetical protein 1
MSVFVESTSYRPFVYPWAVEAARVHAIDMHWDVHQADLTDDKQQYFSTSGLGTNQVPHENHKWLLDKTLSMFTEMDRTVGEGYTKLLPYIKNNEIRNWLITAASREVVHQRAYALAAEEFGFTDGDWKAFASYKEMRDKLEVMGENRIDASWSEPLQAACILAQLLTGEGVGLFGAFTVLLNMKRCGKLIGFNDINQWSLADETDHVEKNIRVLKAMRKDLTPEENAILDQEIRYLIEDYREAEVKYLVLAFEKGPQHDLTFEQTVEYIDYLCRLRLFECELLKEHQVGENPLPWMEWMINAARHDNFFEKKVTDYSHSKLSGDVDYSKYNFMLTSRAG